MALNKQRILNELGSVMNQLQGADCGCMGKLFSNTGQESSMPTCGGCHGGWCRGYGCVGDYGGGTTGGGGGGYGSSESSGYCSMGGTSYGSDAGAPCAGEPYSNTHTMGNMGMPCMGQYCNPPKLYADTYSYLNTNLMQPVVQEVYNDLSTLSSTNAVVNNPMASQMGLIEGNNPRPMIHGNVSTQNQIPNANQLSATASMGQGDPNINTSPVQQSQAVNMAQNMNPGSQQVGAGFTKTPNPVQNTQGVTKFNKMFPGVMQGGELGFDPIAIAMQMNPANQNRTATGAIQNLLSNNTVGSNLVPSSQIGNQQMIRQQQIVGSNAETLPPQNQQQVYTAFTGAPQMNQQIPSNDPGYIQGQRQIEPLNTEGFITATREGYEGTTGDPRSQIQSSPPPVTASSPASQTMMKEPIFPADNSKNPAVRYAKPQTYYQYNNIRRPAESLPGNTSFTTEPTHPKALYSNLMPLQMKLKNDEGRLGVKGTISKTSIMGNRAIGRAASKNQLQQLYQQYKGSQSYTQQNINAPATGGTHSEGRLNATAGYVPPQPQIPVEKVAGDSLANNQMMNKVENVICQIGDVPTSKPQGGTAIEKVTPTKQSKLRNGLQDMVYTSYHCNSAWSFHGDYDTSPGNAAYHSNR